MTSTPVRSVGLPSAVDDRLAEPAAEVKEAMSAWTADDETQDVEAAGLGLDRVRNVAVYLPVNLLDRLKQTRRSRELTYADLLVEAAAAHVDSLESAFRAAAPRVVSGMPSRALRRLPEPGVQVQLRLDGRQLKWLDEQTIRLGAPSRTALVMALFNAHLT